MRIAGNRLARQPHWSIADLTAQLRDDRTRLTTLTAGDLQVRSALAVSYQQLSPSARFMFRRLALVPGADFGVELAAAAAHTDHADAHQQIEELVEATLVQPAATPRRHQFHDLIGIFARERLENEEAAPERDRAADGVYDYLLSTATASGRLFDPDTEGQVGARDQAAVWLEREASNWLAAVSQASAAGWHREVVALARAMHWFSDSNWQYPWADVFERGVTAARAVGDRHAEAALLNFLGWAQGVLLGDSRLQRATHERALATAIEIGERRKQAWALGYIAAVSTRLGSAVEALDYIQRSRALFTELGYWLALNSTRNVETPHSPCSPISPPAGGGPAPWPNWPPRWTRPAPRTGHPPAGTKRSSYAGNWATTRRGSWPPISPAPRPGSYAHRRGQPSGYRRTATSISRPGTAASTRTLESVLRAMT